MKKMIAIVLCCLLLSGCVDSVPPPGTVPTAAPTGEVTEPATDTPTEAVTDPEPVTVTIYYGNDNVDGFETAEVLMEEVDMNVLVDHLIAYGVLAEGTVIQGLKADSGILYMDFNSVFADHVCSMGTSGEYIVIGGVVNTFLDAYGAQGAFITVNNEVLETGHNIYDFELTRFN